jgi:hypothetical protein
MADTITTSVTIKSEFTLHQERTADGLVMGAIDAGTGQGTFPDIDIECDDTGLLNSSGSDTLGIVNCLGGGTFSLTNATTVTLVDFATAVDRNGVALSGVVLKHFGIAITTPDGTKAVRVGPHSVAGACSFGLSGAAHYLSVEHSQVFTSPQAGWTGTKIALANNSGVTVTGSYGFAGKR